MNTRATGKVVRAKKADRQTLKNSTSERTAGKQASDRDSWRDRSLRSRPGFLIRRMYQIHVALFMEECSDELITPVQYSVLTALEQLGTMDQATLARAVALDRTNVADVVARLDSRKLLKRRISPTDKRMMLSSLTEEGKLLLTRLEGAAQRASDRTIEALPLKERRAFVASLKRLIASSESETNEP
jgi:MarR family transcriptional regulator, lower aerobic nicotinate degradation pathway regulator